MIDGKYDEKGTPALVQLMFMGIWIGGWLFLWQGQGWNGWASFGLSTLVLLIVGALVGKLTGNR
jgi:hypothetical protein